MLARSPSLGNKDLPKFPGESNPTGKAIQLPDGHKARAVTLLFTVHPEHENDSAATAARPRRPATVMLVARPG